MPSKDLLIAANTIWVVLAAILVMFMQAGFAFLEAGLTRMKNAAHIAGKNVLIFAVCSLVYYAVGFGIAFGDGNSFIGTSGFFPSSNELLAIGEAPYSFFTGIPAASGYLFEVVFAGVSLAIVWGAMAERAKLWVYPVFGVVFTLIYSVTSHWIWQSGGWLFGKGMQDFAGSTVVHYQGALASNLATGKGGLVYTGSFHQLGVQALGLVTVGAFTFSTCFGSLWAMKRLWGIRVETETETAGLDVSEHGMWGYPEFYIPVPGGYGTETHGHLGLSHGNGHAAPVPAVPAAAPEPAPG